MHWILQDNMFQEEGFKALVEALERLDLPYSIHKVIPFAGTLMPEPESKSDKVIVMGSYTLAEEAKRRGWTPGSFVNENHDYLEQLQHWDREYMFNGHCYMYPFKDVRPALCKSLADKPFFIRPVTDSKEFAGFVTDWPDFFKWQEKVVSLGADHGGTLTGDTLVMVGRVKKPLQEWRTWIVDGKVVTASQYKLGSRKTITDDVPIGVINFANKMAQIWSPAKAYVLDVVLTEGMKLEIMEVNNINASGFYAGDMQKLVMALEELCQSDSGEVRSV